jgi:hypothetical protein
MLAIIGTNSAVVLDLERVERFRTRLRSGRARVEVNAILTLARRAVRKAVPTAQRKRIPACAGRARVETGSDPARSGPRSHRVARGSVDANPSGVSALDRDLVIGQTNGFLFWTPIDLPAGVWHIRGLLDEAAPLSAGYHLFIDGKEVDLETLLTMDSELWT